MPEGVIDSLEVVQVDDEDCDLGSVTARDLDSLHRLVLEQGSPRKTRQLVVRCQMRHIVEHLPSFRDVKRNADKSGYLACHGGHGPHGEIDWCARSDLADQGPLLLFHLAERSSRRKNLKSEPLQ